MAIFPFKCPGALCFMPAIALSAALSGGCAAVPWNVEPAPPAAVPRPQPAASETNSRALEQRIGELELQLLEALVQSNVAQARLDDARREVVRAMAKLQTLGTRAEAASGIAEAEIALRNLPKDASAAATEGSKLMQLATAEFDKQNYAGALYLAAEAKNAAATARSQLARQEQSADRPDERIFGVPLTLQTVSSANVREGPGLSYSVLFVLPAGRQITAHSAARQWLSVTDETGRRGWISQSLIRARP